MALPISIGACEMSGVAVLVVEAEGLVQLQIIVGITKTAVGVAVPKETVIFVRHNEGNGHFGVVLEQVFVFAFQVELFRLVLPLSRRRLRRQDCGRLCAMSIR